MYIFSHFYRKRTLKTHLIVKTLLSFKKYKYTSYLIFFYYFYELTHIKNTIINYLVKETHQVDIVTMILVKLRNVK